MEKEMSVCSTWIKSLEYSHNKHNYMFPIRDLATLTEEQRESIDAYILRFCQCVYLMEKLAEQLVTTVEFSTAIALHEQFEHNSPGSHEEQVNRLNILPVESKKLVSLFKELSAILNKETLQAGNDR